jgi:hypothetical protein
MRIGIHIGIPTMPRPASGGAAPVTPNAQLVLNKAAKTGFTFFIRLL